jgi:hypothetical protein
MSDCTGPTLYPVVLSSIDGECVFAEYDLSTAVNTTTWDNIHDVVMWCCPWLYYWDPPFSGGDIPKGVIVPNTTVPATTTGFVISNRGLVGDSNFPQGPGYVSHSNQFTQLAGGAEGVGTAAYWAEVNPSHETLFYLELGNEVETSAAPAKITLAVSSLSGGPDGTQLNIDSTQTVSYSGIDGTVANWGTSGSSKWSYKFQSANNKSLESLVNVKSSATSAATTGQVFTFNGTRWQASAAPTGGGETPTFALSAATDANITADDIEGGDLLVYNLAAAKWDNVHSLQIDSATTNATLAMSMSPSQTSAVFTASNSGGGEVFSMKGDGSFKVSGTVSAAIVSATEGTFLTVTGIDHGGLGGLGDDDHPQYVLSATNNALSSAYTSHAASTSVHFTEGSIDHGSIAGLGDDDHPQYVLSATNNALSSAYTNHAASASVHFTEGSIDHGSIAGLGDDDHTQYHNDTRGDARYYQKSEFITDGGGEEGAAGSPIKMDDSGYIDGSFIQESDIDHGGLGGLGGDDHTQYSLAAGTRAFTGSVSGVSGTGDGALATMDMFGRMFAHSAYRSGSFTAGQTIFFYLNTNDQDANFVIPAGMTLKILAAYGRCKSGGSAGTTTFTVKLRAWVDDAHSSYSTYSLAAGSTASTNSYFHFYAHGTMESPLASIVGSSNPVGEVGLTHAGPGTSGSDKHTVSVYGVFVDD